MNGRLLALRAEPDRGSEPVGLVLLAIPMLLLIGLMVIGGRIAIASGTINGVAAAAARDASIARTPAEAIQAASRAALADLQAQNLHCAPSADVTVDTSGFDRPPSEPAEVTVNVSCRVSFSDIGLPGLPGSRTLHDQASSPLDPYRSIGLGDGPMSVGDRAGRAA